MWKASLVLMIGVVACHAAMDDMNSMRGYIADTRRETTRHLEAARTASTMQHMRDELDTHRSGMTPMMVDMDVTMDGMTSHCDGSGLGEMRAMHGDLEDEMTQHFATMTASTELATALAEVERHASSTLSMMDGMDGAMGNMRCR